MLQKKLPNKMLGNINCVVSYKIDENITDKPLHNLFP